MFFVIIVVFVCVPSTHFKVSSCLRKMINKVACCTCTCTCCTWGHADPPPGKSKKSMSGIGVERCRKLILLSISRNFGKKLRYYQQQLLQFQQPKIELQSCTLSFLQSCFCSFCRYNFGNFFSDAESADISALDADDFTDVTLVKVTLLM